MSQLLAKIVEHWKTHFTGVSALSIRDDLGISHAEAVARLRSLEAEGVVRLRECQLGEASRFNEIAMGESIYRMPVEWDMVETLIAFPNRPVLEDAFHRDRIDHGVFTNRLHLGVSQVQHFYFKRDVLDKYARQRGLYIVEEDATAGSVRMTTEHYRSLQNPENDGFATVRFGRMTLADRTEAIGAIAKDLDYLPKQEQHHWAAHEIEKPGLSKDDKSWSDYVSEQFEGNWDADHTDYVAVLSDLLRSLNEVHGRLFRKTDNPGLHVPVLNTMGEYVAAHKELYKLIGADNLVQDTLRTVLGNAGCTDADFLNDGGRPKGAWALLKMLAERKGCDWRFFQIVAENRQVDSHRIQENVASEEYYPTRFRDDLKALILELQKLR